MLDEKIFMNNLQLFRAVQDLRTRMKKSICEVGLISFIIFYLYGYQMVRFRNIHIVLCLFLKKLRNKCMNAHTKRMMAFVKYRFYCNENFTP